VFRIRSGHVEAATSVIDRLVLIEAEATELRADNRRLAREIQELRRVAAGAPAGASAPVSSPSPATSRRVGDGSGPRRSPITGLTSTAFSRRILMRNVGGVVAAGAGAAVAGSVLSPGVAAAAPIGGTSATSAAAVVGTNTADGEGVSGTSTNGFGVKGESSSLVGVYGYSSGYMGVSGESSTGIGVRGFSSSDVGVRGVSNSSVGVRGESGTGPGVVAVSTSTAAALVATATNGDGVNATSTHHDRSAVFGGNTNGVGITGRTSSSDQPALWGDQTFAAAGQGGAGVLGTSVKFQGVAGVSQQDVGVVGVGSTDGVFGSGNGNGVRGFSNNSLGSGVYGHNNGAGFGVAGRSDVAGGVGVLADSSSGLGLRAVGGQAPIHLVPSSTYGAPATGPHLKGELVVDAAGVLWQCTGDGAPGTWVRGLTSGTNAMAASSVTLISTSAQTLKAYNASKNGDALSGAVTDPANPLSAVVGTITNAAGIGTAVRGVNNGTGFALHAQNTKATNANGAVRGVGSAAGRGATLSGGAAAVNLVPATGLHPSSGLAGDLFVDSNKDLWLCKGTTTWVQLG
jgi:hypothetical protein